MNVLLPVGMMLSIGLLTGLIGHRFSRRFWVTSTIGAGIATVVWILGVLSLFAFTAPSELGPVIPSIVFAMFAINLVATTTAGVLLRLRRHFVRS